MPAVKKKKKCPKCEREKPLAAFYRVKSRKDGLASWCKRCSNDNRKSHKQAPKKKEYRVIAEIVLKEGKPKTCPTCKADNVPAHKMRGRIENGQVKWDCVKCRTSVVTSEKHVLWGCGWCNEEKMVPPSQTTRHFCSQECLSAWREAKREAAQRRAEAMAAVPVD